jgi:hypothetical protein
VTDARVQRFLAASATVHLEKPLDLVQRVEVLTELAGRARG